MRGSDRSPTWMTADPDCVAPDVDATAAFTSLAEHGYRHIPVVDGERLVGIVSMRDVMRVAQIQPPRTSRHEVPRGLEGVVVAETSIGDVRGLEGFYHYRQYNAVELAERRSSKTSGSSCSRGTFPRSRSGRRSSTRSRPGVRSRPQVKEVLPDVARRGGVAPPLDLLRTTVSLMGAALGFRPSLDVARRRAPQQRDAGVRGRCPRC